MRLDSSNLSPSVKRALRAFYRRRRVYAFARFLLGGLIFGGLLALAAMHADRFLFLSQQLRIRMLMLTGAATVVYVVAGLTAFFLWRARARDVAYDLEKQLPPDCQERLVSAESLAREMTEATNPVQQQLAENLRVFAEDYARQLRSASLAKDPKLRRRFIIVLAIATVCTGLSVIPGYQFGLMAQRFFKPAANLPKPSFVTIDVEPKSIVVGGGGETVIRANVSGEVPKWLRWLYQKLDVQARQCLIASQDGRHTKLEFDAENTAPMSRVRRDLFILSRTELEQSFSFQVRYADAQTKVRFAEVVPHPEIHRLRIRVQPPAYTELPEQIYDSVGDGLRLYADSAVTVEFWVDQPVTKHVITVNERETVDPEWNEQERKGTWTFQFEREMEAEISVENAKGFPNKRGGGLAFAIREDQAPTVELAHPQGRITVVPGELIPVRGIISDDLKIKETSLRYILNPETDRNARFRDTPIEVDADNEGTVDFVKLFDLQETGLAPGDVLRFHIWVRDSGDNDGESQPVTVHARTFARGANERRRVQVLRFVDQALPILERGRIEDQSESDIRKSFADVVTEYEEIDGIPTTIDPLLDQLAVECHFTDSPLDKAGVRHLSLLLAAAAAEVEGTPGTPELRDQMMKWVRYRHHRNLTWRYFGLHREALTLAEKVEEMVATHGGRLALIRNALVQAMAGTMREMERDEDLQKTIEQRDKVQGELRSVSAEIREAANGGRSNGMGGMGGDVVVVTDDGDNELFERREELEQEVKALRREIFGAANVILRRRLDEMEHGEEARQALRGGDFQDFLGTAVEACLNQWRLGRDPDLGAIARSALGKVYTREKAEEGAITQRLRRRAAVYFEIIENTGGELIELATDDPHLDADLVPELQQSINVSARRISGGESAAAERYCRETADNIAALLQDHLIRTLPGAARDAYAALAQFEGQYEQRIQAMAGQEPGAWAQDALARDGEMLQLDPFGFSPRDAIRNLMLRDRYFAAEGAALLFDAGETTAAATESTREAQILHALALQRWHEWRGVYLRKLAELSDDERRVAKALRELELGLHAQARELTPREIYAGRPAPHIKVLTEFLTKYHVGGNESMENLPPYLDSSRVEPAVVLADAVLGDLGAVDVERPLVALADGFGDDFERVKTIQNRLQQGVAPDAMRQLLSKLADQLTDRTEQYRALMDFVRLQIAYADTVRVDREVLYLSLREFYSGWRGRGMSIVTDIRLAAGKTEEPGAIATLFPLLTQLSGLLEAQSKNIGATSEEYMEGRVATVAAGREKYEDYALFDSSRGYLDVCTKMLSEDNPAEVAAAFLRGSEELSRRFITMGSSRVLDAAKAMDRVRDALARGDQGLQAAPLQRQLQEVRDALLTFAESVEQTASFPERDEIREQAGALHEQMRVFELSAEAVDNDVQRNRKVFVLAELYDGVESLLRKIEDLRAAGNAGQTEFTGGPQGSDAERLWRSVEHRRSRLGTIYQQVETAVSVGILEAVSDRANRDALQRACDWAFLGCTMVRSPLTGSVVRIPERKDDEDPKETLKEWLLGQVEEGRKELRATRQLDPYDKVTDEFFGAFADFVRY